MIEDNRPAPPVPAAVNTHLTRLGADGLAGAVRVTVLKGSVRRMLLHAPRIEALDFNPPRGAALYRWTGPWVRPRRVAESALAYPVEAERPSWIAGQDLGRFVVALGRPELAGQAFNLGGPQALRGTDIAAAFSSALNCGFRSQAIMSEQFGASLDRVMGPEAAPLDAMVVDMQATPADLSSEQTSLEAWVRQRAGTSAPGVQA